MYKSRPTELKLVLYNVYLGVEFRISWILPRVLLPKWASPQRVRLSEMQQIRVCLAKHIPWLGEYHCQLWPGDCLGDFPVISCYDCSFAI